MQPAQPLTTLRIAVGDVWAHRRDLLVLGLPAVLVATLAMRAAGALVFGVIGGDLVLALDDAALLQVAAFAIVYASLLAGWAAVAVAAVPFSVAWLRRALPPGERPVAEAAWRWRARHGRFLRRLVQVGLVVFAVHLLVGLPLEAATFPMLAAPGTDPAWLYGIPLIALLAAGLPVVRLAPALAAAALDAPCSLRAAWTATRGRTGSLFALYLFTIVPAWGAARAFHHGIGTLAEDAAYGSQAFLAAATFVELILFLIGWAVALSAIALVWRGPDGEVA